MADLITPERRSRNMAKIKGKNTKPELAVRSLLHGLGYRYHLHRNDLPGRPDIVFSNRKKAVFVHGCFWHQHPGCSAARVPKTRIEFWTEKLKANVDRDGRHVKALEQGGWKTLVVWECKVRDPLLKPSLLEFLGPTRNRMQDQIIEE
jgi:DNA mismatch endonuclease, patch repair protein